ncbi:MAG: penicillin acylase family protein [Vicinamibacterales bacterium]
MCVRLPIAFAAVPILLAQLIVASRIEAQIAERTIAVAGLRAPAEILVDRWGVPHIFAASQDDAFFVQGFNAARDRLFQIDLWRRRGLGQLAEVLGPSYIEQDIAARLFLYRGDMRREWRSYGPRAERIATEFVGGINAYVDWLGTNPASVPLEFKLLGYAPAKWQAADVVRIRSHGLTRNLTREVDRANLACKAGLRRNDIYYGLQPEWVTKVPEGLDPCLPGDVLRMFNLGTQDVRVSRDVVVSAAMHGQGDAPESKAVAVVSGRAGWSPAHNAVADEYAGETTEGSNNWVVAPSKSATGRPILANDPHRAYGTPSLRYLAHLVAPGMNVIGAGEPALPGISIGHNGTVGFGLTIFPIDQEDLHVYELDPANPDRYRYRNGWESMTVIAEEILVKGRAPVRADLRFTRHGPVIHRAAGATRAFAVRTAWSEPGMSPYFGAVRYMFATSWPEFVRAMRGWGAPTENQVYADVRGNIGWIPGGLAPRRPNWDGLLPVPGDGRYEWSGFIPSDVLPRVFNPAQGWWATANHMNLPPSFPNDRHKLGFEWTNDGRYTRIAEVLGRSGTMSVEDSMRLQNDVVTGHASRLLPLVRGLQPMDGDASAARALLSNWDGALTAESGAGALYEVWFARHLRNAFKDAVLSQEEADAIVTPDAHTMLQYLVTPAGRFGGDDVVKRDRLLERSLAAAWRDSIKLLGPDPSRWKWSTLLHNEPPHPLIDAVDEPWRSRLSGGCWCSPRTDHPRSSNTDRTGIAPDTLTARHFGSTRSLAPDHCSASRIALSWSELAERQQPRPLKRF